ncbi:MAG: hypothetical protein WCH75_24965, partial [Candidatus Binatia bacterium]
LPSWPRLRVDGFSDGNGFHPPCCTNWYMNYFAGDISILLVAGSPRWSVRGSLCVKEFSF